MILSPCYCIERPFNNFTPALSIRQLYFAYLKCEYPPIVDLSNLQSLVELATVS
jgi:hypothetical protein